MPLGASLDAAGEVVMRTESALAADLFFRVLEAWVEHPEHVNPPVRRAEVLERGCDEAGREWVRRRLLPSNRKHDPEIEERVVFDRDRGVAWFVPEVAAPEELPFYYPKAAAYGYRLGDHEVCFVAQPLADGVPPLPGKYTLAEMGRMLLRVLVKWVGNEERGFEKRVEHDVYVTHKRYDEVYQALKDRHGYWADRWAEKTDPSKFVFEDIAIAAYLICIWEQEREALGKPADWRQSFVDVGCGNGLLVHILTSEGHRGLGIDLQRRKIWDQYPETPLMTLEHRAVDPLNDAFPDFDWIVGNHTDEMTPWIPFLARASGLGTRFFVLPCCFFLLEGGKMKIHDPARGRYGSYLDYVLGLCRDLGFEIGTEALRIPSTKCTAFLTWPQQPDCDAAAVAATIAELTSGIAFVPKEAPGKTGPPPSSPPHRH